MSKYDVDYETYCPQYPHMMRGMYDIYLQIVEQEQSMLEWRVKNKLAQQEREVEANAVSSQTVALTHSRDTSHWDSVRDEMMKRNIMRKGDN